MTSKMVTKADWEAKKDEIRRLYCEQNETLATVVKILRETSGFQAR